MSLAAAVPLVAGAAVSMVLLANRGARQQATTLAQEVVAQISQKEGAKS